MAKVEFLAIIQDRPTSITLGGMNPAVRFVTDEDERCNIAKLSEMQGIPLKVTVEVNGSLINSGEQRENDATGKAVSARSKRKSERKAAQKPSSD